MSILRPKRNLQTGQLVILYLIALCSGDDVSIAPGFKPICNQTAVHVERYYGKTFVFFKDLKLNWMKAHLKCKEHGMRLPTLDGGQSELEFLLPIIEKNIDFPATGSVPVAWIGVSDIFNEGNFTVLESGRNFSLSFFNPSQPDNAGGNEDCVEFRRFSPASGITINDWVCNEMNGVICEYTHACGCA